MTKKQIRRIAKNLGCKNQPTLFWYMKRIINKRIESSMYRELNTALVQWHMRLNAYTLGKLIRHYRSKGYIVNTIVRDQLLEIKW